MAKVSLNRNLAVVARQKLLYSRYGGFMTVANLMRELGCSRNTAVKFAASLPSHLLTGRRLYDISDVAMKIESARTPPKEIG